MTQLLKNLPFSEVCKKTRRRSKLKANFCLTMYIYRDHKKNHKWSRHLKTLKTFIRPSFGEIPTCFFKKGDIVLNTVTVCVKEALKSGSFHESRKCVNVRAIRKKWTLLIKIIIDQWVYYHFYHFYQKFMKEG